MRILVAPAYYEEMRLVLASQFGNSNAQVNAFAPRVEQSPNFPIRLSCSTCSGTGEGSESTYCRPCRGAGASLTIGMIYNDRPPVTMIKGPALPKRFQPSFPRGLVRLAPLCRGLA